VKYSSPILAVVLAGAVLACLIPRGAPAQVAPTPEVVKGPPAQDLRGLLRGFSPRSVPLTTDLSPKVKAWVTPNVDAQSVVLDWRVVQNGKTKAIGKQVESTSFWPTEVCPYDALKLVVAGKRPKTFTTVIEMWELKPLGTLDDPVFDPVTGQCTSNAPKLPVRRTVIYEKNCAERDVVQAMFVNEGNGNLIVQFYRTKDIYEIDITSGGAALLIQANENPDDPALPFYPSLGKLFPTRWSYESSINGYVYLLGPDPESSASSFVFIDSDLDGVIERIEPDVDRDALEALNMYEFSDFVWSRYSH